MTALTATQTAILAGRAPMDTLVAACRSRFTPFNEQTLRAAATAVTVRHDALRTWIDLAGPAGPCQRVQATVGVRLSVCAGGDLNRAVETARGTPFDARRAPLFRLTALTEPAGSWVLLASCHRVLGEIVTLDALLAEVLDEYGQRLPGTVGFADLEPGLTVLAVTAGVPLEAVMLAAHMKVLAMLDPAAEPATDVITAGSAQPLRAEIRGMSVPGAPATWQELVRECGRSRSRPGQPRSAGSVFDARDRNGPAARHVSDVVCAAPWCAGRDLWVTPASGTLHIRGAQAARAAPMYRAVLDAMAAGGPDGDARAACLPPAERAAVLSTWSTGEQVDRGTASLTDLIGEQAAAAPDAIAVRAPDGRLSYAELIRRARRVGHYLAARGAEPDSLIGVCMRRCVDLVPVLLGIWMSGAAYLPLDPDLPASRLAQMVAEAGCPVVVTTVAQLPVIEALYQGRIVVLDTERAAIGVMPDAPAGVRAAPDQLAYAIYTSGSTGVPKGVLIEHGGLVNYLSWTVGAYASRGPGGAPVFSSIGFDLGIPNLFTPLLTGQATHLLPDPCEIGDLGAMLAAGGPYSFIKLTPGHLELLTHQLSAAQIRDLAGLVIAAGDAFPATLAARWLELAGPGGTRVATEYGPTEITIGNSGQVIDAVSGDGLIPLGAPIPNTTMYVLGQYRQPVPVGVPGEVYIGGAGVARGYLGRAELTAERFVPDPYGPPGARLYRSGDLARWHADGSLHFLGRADRQMKIRGYRVEAAEIEASLRGHPDIRDAVVVASGDGTLARLVAHVVTVPGRHPDPADLRRHLAAAMPPYMIPAAFVPIDKVPLTPNGKVDVRELRSRHTIVRSEERTR